MQDAGYTMSDEDSVISIENVSIEFRIKAGNEQNISIKSKYKTALSDVSFNVRKGDTFGITGETGSGKSTLGKILLGVYKPTGGQITYYGNRINYRKKKDIRFIRENAGIVFQDPVGSLNPKLTVYDIIREGIINSSTIEANEYEDRIKAISKVVGLNESRMDLYPQEISGGEKQRVSIARALVAPKKIVVLDEPTSSLDVSIQAQILNLLKDIKKELDLTYIFITHDINVMKFMSNRLSILYYGKLVEIGSTKDVTDNPLHPYTQRLIDYSTRLVEDENLSADASKTISHEGCIFSRDCPRRMEKCKEVPPETEVEPGHLVSCWLHVE